MIDRVRLRLKRWPARSFVLLRHRAVDFQRIWAGPAEESRMTGSAVAEVAWCLLFGFCFAPVHHKQVAQLAPDLYIESVNVSSTQLAPHVR